MLRNIVRLSLRPIYSAEILKPINVKPVLHCRYATRWSSRRPSAIVNEDELYDDTEIKTHEMTYKTRRLGRKARPERKTEKSKNEKVGKEKPYTPLQADDKIMSSLMLKVKTRKMREKNNLMMLEGFRLIKDAMESNLMPKIVFFNRLSDILPLVLPKEVKLYKIPYRTIQLWSNLTTSPGILAIFDIPEISDKSPTDDSIPLTIICDNIREPGNLGTIIRAAAAVGCERLLLMKGCVDLWEPKVLRSAVGAHFRIPISTCLSWNEIPALIKEESNIFLADNNLTYEYEFENAANQEPNEELNRQLNASTPVVPEDTNINKDYPDNDSIDNDEDAKIDQVLQVTKPNKSTAKTRALVKKMVSQLPVSPYHALDFTQRETVLIIGGETDGVSLESCKLLHERNCVRVNVPLTNGVDSLNVGVALGIVTYEIKRQFIMRQVEKE